MAVTKFIAKIWEARLLSNFHKISVTSLISTKPTEIKGNTIVFGNVGNVDVKDYSGTVDYEELDIPDIELVMDQKKYWAFKVGDVDKVQAAGDLIDPHMAEAAATLGEKTDAYSFSVMATDASTKLGNKAVTAANAYDLVVDMATALNKKKVPKTDRFCIVDSDYLGLLSKDDRFTKTPTVLENGVVEGQKIAGFQMVSSEELPRVNGRTRIIGMQRLGLGFGKQLNETEALRLESSFADGIRGLCVFGGKSLKADCVVTANVAMGSIPVTGVSLNKAEMSIAVGATDVLVATAIPANATNQAVTYESSAVLKATVDENGVVTGVAAGTAIITVTTIDGAKTAVCNVTVTA